MKNQQRTKKAQKKNSQILSQIIATCQNGSYAHYLCIDLNCVSSNKLICINVDCKCNLPHQFCSKGDLVTILKKINSKIQQTQQTKNFIQDTFNNLIDFISDYKQKFLIQIDQKWKYTSLTYLQKWILKKLKGQNQQEILDFNIDELKQLNSYFSQKLWSQINQKTQISQNIFQNLKDQIKQFEKNTKAQVQNVNKKINSYYKPKQLRKYYNIFSALGNNLVLEASQKQADFNRLIIQQYTNQNCQKFQIIKQKQGSLIKLCGSEFTLRIQADGIKKRAGFRQGYQEQTKYWIFNKVPGTDDTFFIQNKITKRVLDVADAKAQRNIPVNHFPFHGGKNQVWIVKEAK